MTNSNHSVINCLILSSYWKSRNVHCWLLTFRENLPILSSVSQGSWSVLPCMWGRSVGPKRRQMTTNQLRSNIPEEQRPRMIKIKYFLLEINWNANLMQQGDFIDVFLARHVSATYGHHQEH